MAKRPTRLRFTEDDLSSDAVKKAAGKAEKAAAKAEKAVDKITPKKHRKLRQEADVSASRTAKLRFGKAKADDIPPKPSGIKRTVTHAPVDTLSANVHKSISRYEDDNVGVQTAHQTELGAETAYHIADHAVYSHKLKAYDKAEKLVSKSDKANVNALFEKFKKDNPNASFFTLIITINNEIKIIPSFCYNGDKLFSLRRVFSFIIHQCHIAIRCKRLHRLTGFRYGFFCLLLRSFSRSLRSIGKCRCGKYPDAQKQRHTGSAQILNFHV